MQALPIDSLLPEVVASLRRTPNLVIEAPPGAGKTTRVPAALLDAGVARDGDVWVLEPRRLAVRLAARRVAEERGEKLGEAVGYQVRFEEVSGARTRLRFLTEGVLTRRLLSEPRIARAGAVVLDEFHERHLQSDLALALLRRLQQTTRPGLRIVAMSATLEAGPVARFLGDCPVLRSEGRRYEVGIEHLARPDERPLAAQVAAAVRRLVEEGLDGDVLVFLPGAAEIRRAQEACAPVAEQAGLLLLPLHGELPAEEQDLAVRPAGRRKVILSTNVAETSVTIEGVVAVIDSGLARVAGHSPWSGLPMLSVRRISRASAAQRAGRAGRTRPGRCLRLYTAQDFAARAEHEEPEVRRLDLAEAALELHAAGARDLTAFAWFEPPPAHALEAAESLLRRLGAVDLGGGLTALGRRMLRLPLHPRLSRLLAEAESRGVAGAACVVAALIGERDIRASGVLLDPRERQANAALTHSPSDLLELYDLFYEAARSGFRAERVRRLKLDANALRAVERVRRQLVRLLGGEEVKREEVGTAGRRRAQEKKAADLGQSKGSARHAEVKLPDAQGALSEEQETALLISILAGYPDRVARRRAGAGDANRTDVEVLLANGGTASLSPASVVRESEFLVAVDAGERREAGRSGRVGARTIVRLASGIRPEWLLDLFPEAIAEKVEVEWNAQGQRVETTSRLMYGQLVLTESRGDEAAGEEAARLLADQALAAGVEAFADAEALEQFLARTEFLAREFPEKEFTALDAGDVRSCLEEMCRGRRSFAELREAVRAGELWACLRAKLNAEQLRLLPALAPERVTLASGRQARVRYERGQTPSVASRLQDFFGLKEGPRVAGGRVPLVLHLLAPSQRPVQVTTDLAGFWSRHYPRVRRELGRRYPRHAWPEDPLRFEKGEG